MQWAVLPKTETQIDANIGDATPQRGRTKIVSMEDPGAGTDKWVYYFYINSSGELGYKKSTDNGSTFGSFQIIDAVPATYIDVAVWYEPWTDGVASNIIHIAGANTTDQGIRYFQMDTNNSDAITGDIVALSSTTIQNPATYVSICTSFDGTVYVACTFTVTAGVRMAESSSPTSSWTDRGAVINSANSADLGTLLPAKTDDDIICVIYDITGTDTLGVMRWDAIGNSWSSIDTSTIGKPITSRTWSCMHDPVTGDTYILSSITGGAIDGLSQLAVYLFDESADTVTLKGTINYTPNLSISSNFYESMMALDLTTNTLILFVSTGVVGSNTPQIFLSHDGGIQFSDPQKAFNISNNDDMRNFTTSYHLVDESLGLHLGYHNDDFDDALYGNYILDRISGHVEDDAGADAANTDVLIFAVDPVTPQRARTFLGRATTDSSGNWQATILDIGDNNIELQIIYDKNLTNDEVDASHRLAVDSF